MNYYRCNSINDGILPKTDRIIVIGDLHADYSKTKDIFIKLKLIDNENNWIAKPKNTKVVQLGDQLDGGGRGFKESSGELELIKFMDDIHIKASNVGGGVYSLIGNHEIMNMLGDFTYASKSDIKQQGGELSRKKIFSQGSDIFNKMSCSRNVVLKIGSFLFAHAGVLPQHIDESEKHLFIKNINKLMRLFLQGEKKPYDVDISKYFLDKTGIIWNREYGHQNPSCSKVDYVTKMLNVGHMIVGHTIQDNINSKCDDKLWRVDVGISDVFNTSTTELLEILDDGESLPKNNFNSSSQTINFSLSEFELIIS